MAKQIVGSFLKVNLGKIVDNYKFLQTKIASDTVIGAVVKANAYGLGAKEVVEALTNKALCNDFFVSTLQEGIEVRKSTNGNIYILHGIDDIKFKREYLQYHLTPVLNHLEQVAIWNKVGNEQGHRLKAILNLETGLGRLGLSESAVNKVAEEPALLEYIDIQYVMSHMACAEQYDHPQNAEQLNNFKRYLKLFGNIKASFANSAGIFLGQEYQFDLVRPGCALFGMRPNSKFNDNPMQNVLEWGAYVLQHKIIEEDQNIGYRALYYAKKGSKLLILKCGYVDGYSRFMSGRGFCYVHGYFLPIVGLVNMDLTIVDASALPDQLFYKTQYVELLGENITIDDIGRYADHIGYELIITRITDRMERIYVDH